MPYGAPPGFDDGTYRPPNQPNRGYDPGGLSSIFFPTPKPALSPTPHYTPPPYVQPQAPSGHGNPGVLFNPPPPRSSAPAPGAAGPAPQQQQAYGGGAWAGGPLGDGYATNATPSLGQDPAYLAFLRALGIEKGDLTQSAATRMQVIDNEITRRLADIGQAGTYSREGIAGNFESRGVLRSSAREVARARQLADEGRQTTALQGAADDQKLLIRQEYDRRIAEANRRLTEQSLDSAGNVYA